MLTVSGAAGGPVAGAVAHLDPLPAHLEQAGIRDASFARVAETLLVVAAVVGDVDGRPGSPGCGLLQVRTWQGVARLVLLQSQRRKNISLHLTLCVISRQAHLQAGGFATSGVGGDNHKSLKQ